MAEINFQKTLDSLLGSTEQAIRDFRSSAENKIASNFFPLQTTRLLKIDVDLANQALSEKARISEAAFTGRVLARLDEALSMFKFPEPEPTPMPEPLTQPRSFCPIFGNMENGV